MEIDDKSKEQLVKLLSVVGPLYTTSLAVCYDVGFFSGLDIGFFTFYSITEHFVFALQALPWALIPALSIVSFVYILWHGYHRNKSVVAAFVEKFKAASQEEREQELARLNRKIKRNKVITVALWAAVTGLVVLCLLTGNYTTAYIVAVSQIIAQFVFHDGRLDIPLVRAALIGVLISTGWIVGFLIGFERAAAILKSDVPREVVYSDASEQKVIIIRSGERGLLYKSFENSKPTFLRWDSIKKIVVL